jgi:hypothetical protein
MLKNFNPENGHAYVFQIPRCFASFCAKEPPIPFVSMLKKMEKVDGSDSENSEWIKLKNQFLISSLWRTWRRSGAPTVPILPHYQ